MEIQNGNHEFSSEIQQAHDHFFRESMQDIEIARQLAFLVLPPKVQRRFDWESLEIVRESWVSEKLKEYRSGTLYRVKMVENAQWVYLLFEHKSAPDKRIHLQLLRYILEIWEQHTKQNNPGELLPHVVPIVICHSNRPCKFNNSMKKAIAIIKEVEETVPDFRFIMMDLWLFKPEQMEDSRLKVLLLALKYSRSPEVLSVLPQIIRISEKVQSKEYDYLKVVLIYLASVINRELIDQFLGMIAEEHSGGEAYMETIADALREKERLKREKIEGELRKKLVEKDLIIEEKEAALKQKDAAIEKKDTELNQKDNVIEKKDVELRQKDDKFEREEELVHQIVRGMAKKGINLQSIQEITGFSKEKIEEILKNA